LLSKTSNTGRPDISLTLNRLPTKESVIVNNSPETPLTVNKTVPVDPVAGADITADPVTPKIPVRGLKVRLV
jgi:hypothetical protein